MVLRKEDVDALTGLGLSVLQAKVYLALADLGSATVKAISKSADVARQDMYRLISELQEMGIVEKIIAAPTEFKALPIREGISILLNRKEEETSKAHDKAMELLNRRENAASNTEQKAVNQFVMIPEREALIFRLEKAFETAQNTVENVLYWRRFSQGVTIMGQSLEEALKRGVTIRNIVEKPASDSSLPKAFSHLNKYSNFEVRFCSSPPESVMGIVDRQEVFIATSTQGDAAESPALWTNNGSVLMLSLNYFESLWTTATKPWRLSKPTVC